MNYSCTKKRALFLQAMVPEANAGVQEVVCHMTRILGAECWGVEFGAGLSVFLILLNLLAPVHYDYRRLLPFFDS